MAWLGPSCALLAAVLHANCLRAGFVYDDRKAIVENPDVIGGPNSEPWSVWWHDFWGNPLSHAGSHGSYRPLVTLSYRAEYLTCGLNPWCFHLGNIILHSLATWLLVQLSSALRQPLIARAFAGLLFACHPIHTEAVAGLVGRADLASGVLFLVTVLLYLRHITKRDQAESGWKELSGSWLAAAASLLAKETGATALLVCVAYDLLTHPKILRSKKIRGPVGVSVVSSIFWLSGLLVLRFFVIGQHTPVFSRADNPTAHEASAQTRLLTLLFLPALNAWLLLCPAQLSFDWSMEAVPRVCNFFDKRNIASLLLYLSLYVMTRVSLTGTFGSNVTSSGTYAPTRLKRIPPRPRLCHGCKQPTHDNHSLQCRRSNNNNVTGLGRGTCSCMQGQISSTVNPSGILLPLLCLTVPFLPASNVFFYVGFVLAERVLYLPSIGLCLLVGLGASQLWDACASNITPNKSKNNSGSFFPRGNRPFLAIAMVALLTAFAVKTVARNQDWLDDESLYRSGVTINPPKALGNLGAVLSSQGRLEEAEQAFKMALNYRTNMADVHYNLGNLLLRQGRRDEAMQSYESAIHYRPTLAVAYVNLALALHEVGLVSRAEAVLVKCTHLDGSGLKDPRSHEAAKSSARQHLEKIRNEKAKSTATSTEPSTLASESDDGMGLSGLR